MVQKAFGGLGGKGMKNAEDTSDCEHRVSGYQKRVEWMAADNILICEFGTIWPIFACFCEIRLQIDSISLIYKIHVNLC
jgi:hypothetical protein